MAPEQSRRVRYIRAALARGPPMAVLASCPGGPPRVTRRFGAREDRDIEQCMPTDERMVTQMEYMLETGAAVQYPGATRSKFCSSGRNMCGNLYGALFVRHSERYETNGTAAAGAECSSWI